MSDNDFADMRGAPEMKGFGSLAGPGAEGHHRADMGRAEDGSGITTTLSCDNCGMRNKITVTWDEFVMGANGAVPPNWVYNQQYRAMQPYLGCVQCRAPLMALYTPDECARHVKSGIAAGALNAAQVQQASQQIQQRLGSMRR